MIQVTFTSHLQRHTPCPPCSVRGTSVREVLDAVFATNPRVRGYILDDEGAVRKHVVVFVNGRPIVDRTSLTDSIADGASVYVMQALSGG